MNSLVHRFVARIYSSRPSDLVPGPFWGGVDESLHRNPFLFVRAIWERFNGRVDQLRQFARVIGPGANGVKSGELGGCLAGGGACRLRARRGASQHVEDACDLTQL